MTISRRTASVDNVSIAEFRKRKLQALKGLESASQNKKNVSMLSSASSGDIVAKWSLKRNRSSISSASCIRDDLKKSIASSSSSSSSPKKPRLVNPQEQLNKLFQSQGAECKIHPSDSLSNFFEEIRNEEVAAYGLDILQAVRESDIEALRKYHKDGRPLKCSNRFGESLLHLACRKTLVKVVDFLVNEIGCPLQVKDDMGRSPLSDAFWTPEPSTELVDIILKKCPDLLLISDKRGFAPLAYARKEHWPTWNAYLERRKHLLSATTLNRTS